jgi:hypothetical protein
VRVLTVNLDDRADRVLGDLESKTGLPAGALLSLSLSLTQWTYQQRVGDRAIATLNEANHSYRVLDLAAVCPNLEIAAKAERAKAEQAKLMPRVTAA